MTGTPWCSCPFDVTSVHPRFSPDWHRAHRDIHLATFPEVDQGTRDNLAMFIELAEQRAHKTPQATTNQGASE